MPEADGTSLWVRATAAGALDRRFLLDERTRIGLDTLTRGTCLGDHRDRLRGASVVLAARSQMATALALLELDGVASRLVLCTQDLPAELLPSVIRTAEATAIVADRATPAAAVSGIACVIASASPAPRPGLRRDEPPLATEWILFTSGTTGQPKLVQHTLASLLGPIAATPPPAGNPVWSTFYDIRRYGGLQILLRALVGGGSLVLSGDGEAPAAFLERAADAGVTRLLGTPTHWRRALQSPAAARISPHYVRLSGEVADQAILDRLQAVYAGAQVVHAFASTEAGVAFEVGDGRAGFPASLIGRSSTGVELRVENDTLRIRSPRTAARYLGAAAGPLADPDGFVDTHDVVVLHGDRYRFAGRSDGVINIGGQKAHPEEIEAVINSHPRVELSLVTSKRSPITGAIVVADVTLRDAVGAGARVATSIAAEILDRCREILPAYKVPATIRIVPSLDVNPSGKLRRGRA